MNTKLIWMVWMMCEVKLINTGICAYIYIYGRKGGRVGRG